MSDQRHNIEVNALLDALAARHKPAEDEVVPRKLLNVLVMGILAAVGALLWTNATDRPLQTAENFAVLQQQTAEIRTTVLEMRSIVTGINERLENQSKTTSDLQSKVSALETQVQANSSRLDRLEDDR